MPYKRWIVELMVPSVTEITVSADNEQRAREKAEEALDEGEITFGESFEHRLSETEIIHVYEEPIKCSRFHKPKHKAKGKPTP